MNNKTLAILGLFAVVAVVALVAIGLTAGDQAPPEEDGLTYHGNGGSHDGSETFHSTSAEAAPYFFVNEGKATYAWNTEADASGDFYRSGDVLDPAVKHLYAIWAYEFSATVHDSSVQDQGITAVLVNGETSFIDPQAVIGLTVYLDPDCNKARLGFAASDRTVVWEADESNTTFTASSDRFVYKVSFSDIVGMTNIDATKSVDGLAAIDFEYSGAVSLTLDKSVTLKPLA